MPEQWFKSLLRRKPVPVDEINRLPVRTEGASRYSAVGFAALTVDSTTDGVVFPEALRRRLGQRGKIVGVLETAQIRFRVDGGQPSTTVGTPLEIGQSLELVGFADVERFRAIRTGGTSGTLHCTYFVEEV